MRITTTILALAVLFASCNQFEKTKSGLAYKLTKGPGKVKLKNGDFIKFNVEYKIREKIQCCIPLMVIYHLSLKSILLKCVNTISVKCYC